MLCASKEKVPRMSFHRQVLLSQACLKRLHVKGTAPALSHKGRRRNTASRISFGKSVMLGMLDWG
jgi:hypothetical protein